MQIVFTGQDSLMEQVQSWQVQVKQMAWPTTYGDREFMYYNAQCHY